MEDWRLCIDKDVHGKRWRRKLLKKESKRNERKYSMNIQKPTTERKRERIFHLRIFDRGKNNRMVLALPSLYNTTWMNILGGWFSLYFLQLFCYLDSDGEPQLVVTISI